MESFKVVRPEHLNHYGYLFGGFLLKWVDEISWIAASRDYPGCRFVTVAMDKVEFRSSVHQGTVLRFKARRARVGGTSVQYTVKVYADDLETGAEEAIFSTHVSFVCLDGQGEKKALPVADA
ncbi:MAG: acyl-CoA thioesterase [Betaproteobacteria bacterium]|jgi:acyl-CoA hydrolase|nr:MAG: thioesterase superfamily protein [bacterium]KAF0149635.1 MAG: thioesterase superfamily protein [bacterium]KAF0169301.1 MAG: thioesterase superfamily protein [bacterium]MBM4180804.1 acyl-CoA thioesterase [Betaproteobacteria bacterium]TXT16346.1 MAG: thioesterase superfamily protein [bacterium]